MINDQSYCHQIFHFRDGNHPFLRLYFGIDHFVALPKFIVHTSFAFFLTYLSFHLDSSLSFFPSFTSHNHLLSTLYLNQNISFRLFVNHHLFRFHNSWTNSSSQSNSSLFFSLTFPSFCFCQNYIILSFYLLLNMYIPVHHFIYYWFHWKIYLQLFSDLFLVYDYCSIWIILLNLIS